MSKVWIITGAGSGIGAETVKAAIRAGDRVVASGRNTAKVRRALSDVEGDRLSIVELDVTEEAQAEAAVAQAVDRFGRLDVLVNNAGFSLIGNFEELALADIERQMATNFYGVVHLMRTALPVMRRQRSGHIINISSVAGAVGLKHCSAYSAAKFAVEGLSSAVAAEVEKFGIDVTVVEPGFFRTDLLDARNVQYPASSIEDYADESVEQIWSQYHGAQQGDPTKLGEVLVEITRMQNPPRVFAAGSDALAMITPAVEARLADLRSHDMLSRSTDGSS